MLLKQNSTMNIKFFLKETYDSNDPNKQKIWKTLKEDTSEFMFEPPGIYILHCVICIQINNQIMLLKLLQWAYIKQRKFLKQQPYLAVLILANIKYVLEI